MSVLMVSAKVKEESAAEAKAAAQKMFAAIHQEHPTNIRYGSCMLADGVTFVALLEIEEGTENPLPGIPAWQEFTEKLQNWYAEPPALQQMKVVGSYRLFD